MGLLGNERTHTGVTVGIRSEVGMEAFAMPSM